MVSFRPVKLYHATSDIRNFFSLNIFNIGRKILFHFPHKNCQTELSWIILQSGPGSYSGSFLESFRIRIGILTYRLHGYGSDAHFEYEVKVKSVFYLDKNLYYKIHVPAF